MTFFVRMAKEMAGNVIFLMEKYRFITAKRRANRRHFLDGKKYWVIKLQGKYHVLSTVEIKEFKKRGIFRKDLDHLALLKIAAYCTTEKNIR